jgi:hypothetical protein
VSTVKAIRAKLVEWAEAFDWSGLSGTLVARAEAPRPRDGVSDLPTLALWFSTVTREFGQPTEHVVADDGAVGWLCGQKDSDLELLFRLGSYDDAEEVRDAFERTFVSACVSGYTAHQGLDNVARSENLVWGLELDWGDLLAPSVVTDPDQPRIAMSIHWQGDDTLEAFELTGERDLFELRYSLGVTYPWVERQPAPDRWDISIENEEPDGDIFTFDVEDYEG